MEPLSKREREAIQRRRARLKADMHQLAVDRCAACIILAIILLLIILIGHH